MFVALRALWAALIVRTSAFTALAAITLFALWAEFVFAARVDAFVLLATLAKSAIGVVQTALVANALVADSAGVAVITAAIFGNADAVCQVTTLAGVALTVVLAGVQAVSFVAIGVGRACDRVAFIADAQVVLAIGAGRALGGIGTVWKAQSLAAGFVGAAGYLRAIKGCAAAVVAA